MVILNTTILQEKRTETLLGVTDNELLRTLPFEATARLVPMTCVWLRQGAVLCKPRERRRVVYFPSGAVVSLMARTANTSIEVATVGPEGIVGPPAFMGRIAGAAQWTVQVAGTAWQCDADAFEVEVIRNRSLESLLRRYEYSLMIQAVQAAACMSAHRLEQRCARWLLATHDRIADDCVPMTHEFIGAMLSVRRAGITMALRALQDRGIVRCRRGATDILDRVGLESAACECYGIARAASDALLGVRPERAFHSLPA